MSKVFSQLSLIGLIFLSWCSEYRQHHEQEYAQYIEGEYIFSSWANTSITILPNPKEIDTLTTSFDSAKKRIWVEIYTWTERDTVDAAIRAYRRGVDVRVILEGNDYGTPRINDETYKKLQDADIPVVFADNTRYTFTHAKFWIIDQSYCVDTGNLTYSSFKDNRDIIVCDSDTAVLSTLEDIFQADERHERPLFRSSIPLNIGISPINMRSRIRDMIHSAQKSISIYVQDISDTEILSLLEEKLLSDIDVRVCIADNDSIDDFSQYHFQSFMVKKPYLHAKAISIDGVDSMIGSINLTQNALDNNREVAIFYKNNEKISTLLGKLFLYDCIAQKFAK